MYLPELNHISQQRYSLSGFGGINRRETAGVGELADAVNLSSDEYPLIMPRKRYDVGTFPKTALMWHNNDRDMALVPALKSDDVITIDSQKRLIMNMMTANDGRFGVVNASALSISVSYVTGDTVDGEEPPLMTYELKPGKAYWINKSGWNDNRGCMKGTVEPISDKSYISYKNKKIEIPDVVAFKNPVSANIGTSTVICDEINGMWVLEYGKDGDTYSYNKVQNKYEVVNEMGGTTSNPLLTGGQFCHLRVRFEDNTLVKQYIGVKTENELDEIMKESGETAKINWLIGYGSNPAIECQWYRLTSSKTLLPVDNLIYEFCTIDGAQRFFTGDYVELTMSAKLLGAPDFKEELSELNGMYEVYGIGENLDGVKYSVMLKGSAAPFTTIGAIINGHAKTVRPEDTTITNNIYLSDGMTIERKAPENVRFICSHQNRIWANNGNNEIMCCARGNPYVWYRYEGNALDSWAATIGGDGAFTGCINYGYPLFFKDNRMFRVTGSRPSNFGYDEYSIKGIKNGCHDSAVIVNDVLYYQSIDGIYAYNASTPVCVSEKIYKDWQRGKACRFRDKYYIAVTEDEKNRLYCYDTRSGVWHREDMGEKEIRYLYPGRYLDGYEEYMTVYTDCDEENYTGYTVSSAYTSSTASGPPSPQGEGLEDPVIWFFETTDLLADEPETKYLKGIYVNCRVYPEEENEIELSVQYNGDGEWRSLAVIGPQKGDSRSVWYKYPLAGKRCDNLKIKAEGIGKAVIYNITLEFEKGSTKR